jgi:hypothetical protein
LCRKTERFPLVHAAEKDHQYRPSRGRELGPRLIASHTRTTFSAVETSTLQEVKQAGAFVGIISADSFGAKQVEATPDLTFALLKEGLVRCDLH